MTTITGLILAGGRATRMGGDDKGLIEIAGKTMVARIAEQFAPQVDEILINANRNYPQYEQLGYPVISDPLEDFQGPLAGMLSGLQHLKTDWLITAPCDGPFLDEDYVQRMMEAAQSEAVVLAVARDRERLQPVYCLINKQLDQSIAAFLESGDRKIDRWFAQHAHTTVTFDREPSMFTNVNTPEQLSAVETIMR